LNLFQLDSNDKHVILTPGKDLAIQAQNQLLELRGFSKPFWIGAHRLQAKKPPHIDASPPTYSDNPTTPYFKRILAFTTIRVNLNQLLTY
jgi:hypothetical protein